MWTDGSTAVRAVSQSVHISEALLNGDQTGCLRDVSSMFCYFIFNTGPNASIEI